ncbi:hypothetical protein Mterra_02948 [Calidithermus terrae]|uniref:Uncharacterized protein n=1 Tax=Calidithermus terrae TaxID=1408545 RepID=A0A399EE46_9DEIN|nr:hypothetical protein [Calidithermus terrae]RIH81813.1 hypothetical protein Mterra_02948 [Calidithermus terrae]
MGAGSTPDSAALADHVRRSVLKAEAYTARLRRSNTRLLLTSLFASGASTLVTGVTAAGGPVVGSGIEGWRLACVAGAVLGFAATVSTGAVQQLKVGDRLSEGNQCLGRLRLLEVAISTRSRPLEDIAKEYAEVLKTYPEPLQ